MREEASECVEHFPESFFLIEAVLVIIKYNSDHFFCTAPCDTLLSELFSELEDVPGLNITSMDMSGYTVIDIYLLLSFYDNASMLIDIGMSSMYVMTYFTLLVLACTFLSS